jgi:hypothetical protein
MDCLKYIRVLFRKKIAEEEEKRNRIRIRH